MGLPGASCQAEFELLGCMGWVFLKCAFQAACGAGWNWEMEKGWAALKGGLSACHHLSVWNSESVRISNLYWTSLLLRRQSC